MTQPQDTFWKWFFATAAGAVCFGAAVIAVFVARPYSAVPTLPHDDVNEPFAFAQGVDPSAPKNIFYRESTPLGFGEISWRTATNWRSSERHFEGSYSARAQFLENWSGAGLENNAGVSTAAYRGITLAIYAEPSIEELYLEIYDKQEKSIGRQPLSWYYPDGKLTTGTWQKLVIPLENFSSAIPSSIRGFSIISPKPGVAFIDDVHLVTQAAPHSAWTAPAQVAGSGTDLSLNAAFARTAPLSLPYTLPLTPESLVLWYVPEGQFSITQDKLAVGPLLNGGSTHAVFLPGLAWRDYRINTIVDWGPGATFSLLARISSDNKYVACNFSAYGGTAQIYLAAGSESELIAETPYLGVPAMEAWAKVSLGIEVKDNNVSCIVRGEKVLSGQPKNMSLYGTAGIEVWDTNPMQQPHKVRSFTVVPL